MSNKFYRDIHRNFFILEELIKVYMKNFIGNRVKLNILKNGIKTRIFQLNHNGVRFGRVHEFGK